MKLLIDMLQFNYFTFHAKQIARVNVVGFKYFKPQFTKLGVNMILFMIISNCINCKTLLKPKRLGFV